MVARSQKRMAVIVIPVYKQELDDLEMVSLAQVRGCLANMIFASWHLNHSIFLMAEERMGSMLREFPMCILPGRTVIAD